MIHQNVFFKDANLHVCTYALGLDKETDERLAITYKENSTLTVMHLESFYNYRTIGANFELHSSILSHHDICKRIEIYKNSNKLNTYVVTEEIKCTHSNAHYANIHSKKQRICAAFTQLKNENKDKAVEESFLNYCNLSVDEIENDTTIRVKPKFCRDELEKTAKKLACVECDTVCAFTLEDLLDPSHGIGQIDIKLELEKHHHPKTRKIENRQRSTNEAARELADHYIYSHNKIEFEVL